MAIIDLGTGKAVIEAEGVTTIPVEPEQAGRIINLDTGSFEQPTQPEPAQEVAQVTPTVEDPQKELGFLDKLVGGLETAATIATGVIAEPLAGIAGGISALAPGPEGQGARAVEATRDFLTFQPQTEGGERVLQATGEAVQSGVEAANVPLSGLLALTDLLTGADLDAANKRISDVQTKGFAQTISDDVFEATGSEELATIAHTLPVAILEGFGLKGFRAASKTTPRAIERTAQDAAEQASAIKATEASTATGVDLFPAQKTLNPTDIERQAFVAQLPESATKARNALTKQNQQVATAVDDFIETLAPADSVSTASTKFRTAADRAIEIQKEIRREAASPIYKQAFRRQRKGQLDSIKTKPLETKISQMIKQFDPEGEIAKNLNKSLKKIQNANGDLQKLHLAKTEIDQIVDGFGADSVGATTKRFMSDANRDLVNILTEQSPSYRAARDEFIRTSPGVKNIQDSILGKIANMDDTQLKNAAQRVFDPAEANTSVIRNAKKAIQEADPAAWDTLLRSEFERRMGTVRADIGDLSTSAALENIPSQMFNSIFGNKKSRDILFASLDKTQAKNLKYLETVLRRATKGRPGGSPTAIRSEIQRELKGGVTQALREWVGSPIKKLTGLGEEASFNARTKALSDVLFDPAFSGELSKIIELPPASSQAKRLMKNLLNSALVVSPGIEKATKPQEQ